MEAHHRQKLMDTIEQAGKKLRADPHGLKMLQDYMRRDPFDIGLTMVAEPADGERPLPAPRKTGPRRHAPKR